MAAKEIKGVDVLIVGDGIAGCTAALAAHRKRVNVIIVEKSLPSVPHGNTAFSGGALRRVSSEYTAERYFRDIMKVSKKKADPLLTRITIRNSRRAKAWLARLGVRWIMPTSNPGRANSVLGRGPALASALRRAVKKARIPTLYGTRVLDISISEGRAAGVEVSTKNGIRKVPCKAVILATGGFQGDRKMVVRYLGKGGERLALRGYTGNTGDGHKMVMKLGARLVGMEGYHGGIIHYGYKEFPRVGKQKGMRSVKKYEGAILVNQSGNRFVDEGEDTADKTYAKFGKIIALTQPGGIAYLIFDAKSKDTVDPMYHGPKKGPVESPSLEDLARKLSIHPLKLRKTIDRFNDAIYRGKTAGLSPPKSHFAQRIDKAPFYAYPVTGGMTFTFGGIKISEKGEVLGRAMKPIPGVFAAGEVTGGFFFHNYPAGSSLTRCAVFGEITGQNAANYARRRR